MSKFPLSVSVVIPVYNAVDFLETAVMSALNLPQVGEVMLVEDGGNDGSFEKCKMLELRFERVKVMTHPGRVNKGAASSRNLGILHASFPLIAFLDADDYFLPNRFDEDLYLLSNHSLVMATYANVEVIDSDSGFRKIIGMSNKPKSISVLQYLLKGGYFHTSSITVKKDFFSEVGYFNSNCWPHEDSEMWIRMASRAELKQIPSKKPVATYQIHGNNLSQVASSITKMKMWKSVFQSVFFMPIGIINKILILRQLVKYSVKVKIHFK